LSSKPRNDLVELGDEAFAAISSKPTATEATLAISPAAAE
jgi:hypothetical protein